MHSFGWAVTQPLHRARLEMLVLLVMPAALGAVMNLLRKQQAELFQHFFQQLFALQRATRPRRLKMCLPASSSQHFVRVLVFIGSVSAVVANPLTGRALGETPPPGVTDVRLGMLLPMFGTEAAGYAEETWSPRIGALLALRVINNKTDGVADHLLPTTHLRIAYTDSKCDAGRGITSALHVAQHAFGGQGAQAIIGTGCSGAAATAAHVALSARVPLISPSATSPSLSDGKAHPYFLRTIPSDAFGTIMMVDILQTLWNYSSVALIHSTDSYGIGGADAFIQMAAMSGLSIRTTQSFFKDSTDFSIQQTALMQAGSRVIVLMCPGSDASRFLRTALQAGVGGPGYLFFGGDTLATTFWESDPVLATDDSQRQLALRGLFAFIANTQGSVRRTAIEQTRPMRAAFILSCARNRFPHG